MASYGKLRTTTILGQAGTTWYVQLWKKEYTGASSDMTLSGQGFEIKWSGQGGTRDAQFLNSECVLDMYAENTTDEDLIYDIFSKGDRAYYIRIYKNGESSSDIWWFGWVNPSFSKIENAPFPYKVNIKATDSIGTFSKRSYDVLSSVNYGLIERVNTHIKDFGDKMGLYDLSDNLLSDGTFPLPNVNWAYSSSWSIPSGGGSIDYDGGSGTLRQSITPITQGDNITFSITILNLAEGEVASIAITNQNGDVMLQETSSVYLDFSTNGNHIVSGASLEDATEIKLQPQSSATVSFSVTDIVVLNGTDSNASPCPIENDWFQTSIDWWRDGDTYQSDDPFYLYRTSKAAYIKKPEESPQKYKEYDVLKGVLKTFNTTCVLSEGKYNFIQPNNWMGNTNGWTRVYQYDVGGDNRDTTASTLVNLLSVNQTDATILAGSSITFEPSFKEVTANHKQTSNLVVLIQNVDANTALNLGYIDASAGSMEIKLSGTHTDKYLTSVIAANLPSGYEVPNWGIEATVNIDISITDGTNTYYLNWSGNSTNSSTSIGTWSLTNNLCTAVCGYNYPDSEAGANPTNDPTATYPTRSTRVGEYWYMVSNFIQTVRTYTAPPISGVLSIQMNALSSIRRYNESTGSTQFMPFSMSIESRSTVLNADSHIQSIEVSENEPGAMVYTASQNTNISEESFDLGDITVGSPIVGETTVLNQFNIAYTLAGEVRYVSDGFRRGNSGDYSNVTQLLVDEFLQLQVEPLEILQAEIFSSTISPTKLLKYSINDDGSYNYYAFMGGSFSPRDETMNGEWYKVSASATVIQEEDSSSFSPLPPNTSYLLSNFKSETNTLLNENSLGVTSTEYVSGTSINKIDFNGTLRGKIYDGQKLSLQRYAGNSFMIVEVDGDQAIGLSAIDIQSITPDITIPIGSTLSVLTYDLSNVITGGSSVAAPQTDKIDLTSAQYQALGGTPITLIAAPGTGKVIVPISIYIYARRTSTETSSRDLYIGDTTSTSSGSYYTYIRDFMNNETGNRTYVAPPTKGEIAQGTLANRRLQIYSNGTLNGDIALTVYVTYQIMDI